MTEKGFEKLVIKELENNYLGYVLNVEGLKRGVPDIICSLGGDFFAFELKLGSSYKVQPHQVLQIEKIRKSGGAAFCLTYSEDWKEELEKMVYDKTYKQEFEKIEWD